MRMEQPVWAAKCRPPGPVFPLSCGERQRHTDSAWSWLVCGASFVSLVVLIGTYYCFGLLLPHLMDHFDQTRASTAWIGSLYITSGNFFGPAISWLIHRLGFRATAAFGGLFTAAGFILSSFAPRFWVLYFSFGFLCGVAHKGFFNSSTLIVVKYFVKSRSIAVGILTSAGSVGLFVMPQVTRALLQSYGWQGTLRGLAALTLTTLVSACVFDPDVSSERSTEAGQKLDVEEQANEIHDHVPLRKNRVFVLFCFSAAFAFGGYFVPSVHMAKHCQQDLGFSVLDTTMLYSYMGIASFFSRHAFCKLGDKLDRFLLYQIALVVNGLALVLCSFGQSYAGMVAFFVVYGSMDGGLNGLYPMLVLECVGPDNMRKAFGTYCAFAGIGITAGPPIAGLLADKFGSYVPSFCAAGGLLLCGALIMLLRLLVPRGNRGSKCTEITQSSCSTTEELVVAEMVTVL